MTAVASRRSAGRSATPAGAKPTLAGCPVNPHLQPPCWICRRREEAPPTTPRGQQQKKQSKAVFVQPTQDSKEALIKGTPAAEVTLPIIDICDNMPHIGDRQCWASGLEASYIPKAARPPDRWRSPRHGCKANGERRIWLTADDQTDPRRPDK
jgi:hypothetical protein